MRCRNPFEILALSLGLLVGLSPLSAEAQSGARPRTIKITPRTARASAPAALPAAPVEDVAPQANEAPENQEVVRERYPNGGVMIERYTTQDADGNYVNHGPYTLFDQKGHKIGGGSYVMGKQTGAWYRIISAKNNELLSGKLYEKFQSPFRVEVTLVNGQIDGLWTIFDARGQKASEFEFTEGRRTGISSWYSPSGVKVLEAEYKNNQLDGPVTAWNENGQVVKEEDYVDGYRLANRTLYHAGTKRKKAQGPVAVTPATVEVSYDWWNCAVQTIKAPSVAELKHGDWTWWFASGQVQSRGRFEADSPVGKWVYWHENGQKHSEGEYIAGAQTGKWRWWQADGLMAGSEDHTGSAVAEKGGIPHATARRPERSTTRPPAKPKAATGFQSEPIPTPDAGEAIATDGDAVPVPGDAGPADAGPADEPGEMPPVDDAAPTPVQGDDFPSIR